MYKEGKQNRIADALSRIRSVQDGEKQTHQRGTTETNGDRDKRGDTASRNEGKNADSDEITEAESEKIMPPEETADMTEISEENSVSQIHEGDVMSAEEKLAILKQMHVSPIGGHQGMGRTYERIKQYYTWPGMKADVENFIKTCESCQKNKVTQAKTKQPLELTPTPEFIFERCDIDIVGPLPVTQSGHKYILTFQDSLTKYVITEPARQDAGTIE